jgi:N-acetyl-S-(2-succino)cysteine monooxygenase
MHVLDNKGTFFSVQGPLNVGCLPQVHPIVVQAGASEQGRELAAATADIVYAVHPSLQVAQAFYADLKRRLARYGRSADDLKILPALRPVVGRTTQEARAKYNQLQQLLDPLVGLARLSQTFGDLSGYPLDGPVPLDRLGPAELRSISAQLLARVQRQNPTIRELYQEVAGMGGFCLIGAAAEIVDVMQEWFEHDACDGFNITPTHLPGGCEDFVEMVTPELQRRGLFRKEYQGRTLRENLGLGRPMNRYAARRAT